MDNPYVPGTESHAIHAELIEMAEKYKEVTGELAFLGCANNGFYRFVDGFQTQILVDAYEHMCTHMEDAYANFI